MSGQLLCENEGAPCNLLVSPVNVNASCPVSALVAEVFADELAGRNIVQGTGTNWPPAAALVALESLVLEVLDVPVELVPPAVGLKEITAKSIRPDAGFRMTSLIVPRFSPEAPLT
jgi:hypothetical protein